MGKGVFLWSTPRSVSTAFEFSIRTLPNAKVFNHTYANTHFVGPDDERNADCRKPPQGYTGSRGNIGLSYAEVSKMIQAEYPGKDFVFVKEFAMYLQGRFEMFLDKGFKDFTHTFLIRHPQLSILSLYIGSMENRAKTGWEYFNPKEAGVFELRDLYNFVSQRLRSTPVVIDANDLLANPNAMMKAYCAAVGIAYQEGMTSWEPGGSQDFIDQKLFGLGWNEDVLKSSGFTKPTPIPPLPRDLPASVVKCIEECLVPYHELYRMRLVPEDI